MGKPFKINLDSSRSFRAMVRDILGQAEERQKKGGMYYVGAVLEHLVEATLNCVLAPGKCSHNPFSAVPGPGRRAADFYIADFYLGDNALYVTSAPVESVIAGCRENLDQGFRPVVVTLQYGVPVALGLAENVGLENRIDVFDIEQFVVLNLYKWSGLGDEGYKSAITNLINRYNEIVREVETDRNLRIELCSEEKAISGKPLIIR